MGLMVDHLSRTLTSSCRSGPMWYTDQYRFAGATLYLYRAESVLMLGDTVNAALQWEQREENGPLAVWRTYDPAGRVLKVPLPMAWAHRRMDRCAASRPPWHPRGCSCSTGLVRPAPSVTWCRAIGWNCWMNRTAG